MTLRALISRVLAATAALLALAACNVHEVPVGEDTVHVTLYLNFDEELPLYKEIDYVTRSLPDYKVRHTVQLYHSTGKTDSWADVPDFTEVFYSDNLNQQTLTFTLEPILYKVLVWTEYVDSEGNSLFYDSGDFCAIVTTNPNVGNTDAKDAFRGELDLNLSTVLRANADFVASIDMERPLAKYRIVATDREEFLQMYIRRLEERWARENAGQPFDVKSSDLDVSLFRVDFIYTGFLPDTYNNWTDRPVDSRTQVQFSSLLKDISGNELELGFDYMLAGPQESGVNLQIRIYDDRDDIISISNLDVPMMRSHLTTMKGKFLTSGAASGISIDPGYDGEFNIPL